MYKVGETLTLLTDPDGSPIKVRIHSLPVDFTLSVILVVDVLDAQGNPDTPTDAALPTRAALKLYDRRFANQYRRDNRLGDWAPDLERELVEFSRSGKAKTFLDRWQNDDDLTYERTWPPMEKEIYLWDILGDNFEMEVDVYHELRKYQGKGIPRLHSKVSYITNPKKDDSLGLGSVPELFTVHGILMEYIDGFRMSNLPDNIQRTEWNSFIERAVATVGAVLNTSTVLNQDVRPDNMLVWRDGTSEDENSYRFVMIDFGQCRIREDDESDEEWGLSKKQEDEENAMGGVMKIKLRNKVGFEAEYRRRETWTHCRYEDGC